MNELLQKEITAKLEAVKVPAYGEITIKAVFHDGKLKFVERTVSEKEKHAEVKA